MLKVTAERDGFLWTASLTCDSCGMAYYCCSVHFYDDTERRVKNSVERFRVFHNEGNPCSWLDFENPKHYSKTGDNIKGVDGKATPLYRVLDPRITPLLEINYKVRELGAIQFIDENESTVAFMK